MDLIMGIFQAGTYLIYRETEYLMFFVQPLNILEAYKGS